MPDKATLDQTALDYGVLVAETKKLREEGAELRKENESLAATRAMLNDEVAAAEEAKTRVRRELVDIEEQKKAMQQVASDELSAEKRVFASSAAATSSLSMARVAARLSFSLRSSAPSSRSFFVSATRTP
jgi:chromosome segregation ATPase